MKMNKNQRWILGGLSAALLLVLCACLGSLVLLSRNNNSVAGGPTALPTDAAQPRVATPTPPPVLTATPSPAAIQLPAATPTPAAPPPTSTRVVADTPPPAASDRGATTAAPPALSGAAPVNSAGNVAIVALNKQAEYVDLRNNGAAAVDLSGWRLLSEKGSQECGLGGIIQPGKTLRVWAKAGPAGQGGYSCGHNENIWNNFEPDAAILFDAAGVVVSRME